MDLNIARRGDIAKKKHINKLATLQSKPQKHFGDQFDHTQQQSTQQIGIQEPNEHKNSSLQFKHINPTQQNNIEWKPTPRYLEQSNEHSTLTMFNQPQTTPYGKGERYN